MADLVARARDLAHRAHAGQVDKAGRPYIEHVRRVADTVAATGDDVSVAVAWLHDVLEDGGAECIEELNDSPDVVRYAVTLLTRCDDVPCAIYYSEIRTNPTALRVKLADIADNADESRLALLDKATADRLRRKYAHARKLLGATDAPEVGEE